MLLQCSSPDWSGRVKGLSALAEAVLEGKHAVASADLIGKTLAERLEDRNHRVGVPCR
jgi:hypothetical protein